MVTASATAEAVTYDAETDTVNANVFRATFTDPFQGPVLASLAKDEFNADKVYCLSENGDDYGAGLVNYFKEKANELGIEVIEDVFPSQNADFTSYMNNAKKEGVKAIFAPVSISYAQLIIDQATAQGVNVPILGSDTWDTNTIFEVAKGKDIDIYVSTFYQEGANPEFEKGIKEWINADSKNLENNGGNDMLSAVTVMGYDAYMVALEAIKAAGSTDPAAVMAALPGVTYEGISGHIEFNETGDANRDSAYIKSVNTETGAWDFVKVQKAS
jgi:branched-chain amino acid transport system substrate-binding protein